MNASALVPSQLAAAPPTTAASSSVMGVVELKVTYPDGQTAIGTGAMIDSSHVLTAAHILYSAKDGGYVSSVEAIPAANGMGNPAGVAFGTNERVDPSWLSFNPSHPGATSPTVEDIGLVTLDRPIGDSTGWFGLGSKNDASFTGATFDTAGYPANPRTAAPRLQVESGKSLGAVSTDSFAFTQSSLSAAPGQSGSPIYQITAKGSPVIYGVLTGADGFSASNTVYTARLTPSVIAELHSWENADSMLPTPSGLQGIVQHPASSVSSVQSTGSAGPMIHALGYFTADGQYVDDGSQSSTGYYTPDGQYVYTGPAFVPASPTISAPSDYNNPFVQGIGQGYYDAYQLYNYLSNYWNIVWGLATYEEDAW